MPVRAGARARRPRTATTILDAYVGDLGNVHRHGRDPRRRAAHRRRSARRRRRALLGADRRALRARPDRGQRRGRSDLPLHDASTGTARSAWILVALRHAAPDRAEGPLRHRVRLRHRPRPPRHRHAAAPGCCSPNHYLAVAIDYLFRHRPQWRGRRRGRQDRGQQQHDRPRGGAAGPQAVRGAGRLQVVRRRAARRLARLRRRGERGRRRSCAATARVWTTDKDGIDRRPARGRDHRAHRPRPGRALRGPDRANSASRSTSASTRRPPPSRRSARPSSRREQVTLDGTGRRADRRAC